MEDSEKNRYIEFLIHQKEERDRTIADKDTFIKNLQETLDMLKLMHESDSKNIDEMLAKINNLTTILKRNIRPLTVECKNFLLFGDHARAEMSALYHTFIVARPLVACRQELAR